MGLDRSGSGFTVEWVYSEYPCRLVSCKGIRNDIRNGSSLAFLVTPRTKHTPLRYSSISYTHDAAATLSLENQELTNLGNPEISPSVTYLVASFGSLSRKNAIIHPGGNCYR